MTALETAISRARAAILDAVDAVADPSYPAVHAAREVVYRAFDEIERAMPDQTVIPETLDQLTAEQSRRLFGSLEHPSEPLPKVPEAAAEERFTWVLHGTDVWIDDDFADNDGIRFTIEGDFASCANKLAYARRIVDLLNATPTAPVARPGAIETDSVDAPFDHNMRRLTGLWRYGINVLPPAQITDFYAWCGLLDAAISAKSRHPLAEALPQAPQGEPVALPNAFHVPAAVAVERPALTALPADVIDALTDAWVGWLYIRSTHGDLSGVGWDRVEKKLAGVLDTLQVAFLEGYRRGQESQQEPQPEAPDEAEPVQRPDGEAE